MRSDDSDPIGCRSNVARGSDFEFAESSLSATGGSGLQDMGQKTLRSSGITGSPLQCHGQGVDQKALLADTGFSFQGTSGHILRKSKWSSNQVPSFPWRERQGVYGFKTVAT
jgi:hypothetical protein